MGSNYPWPMDKDPESILTDLRIDRGAEPFFSTYTKDAIVYLVDRLKIAEAERDDLKKQLVDAWSEYLERSELD